MRSFYLITIFILSSCTFNNKMIKSIQRIDFIEKIDTIYNSENKIMGFAKNDIYIIKDFNLKDSLQIDLFVEKVRDKNWLNKYITYSISFFKESNKTNYKNIKNNPTIISKFSVGKDFVYYYVWSNNKFIGKEIINHEEESKVLDIEN